MAKFLVKRGWHGVNAGSTIEIAEERDIHPSLRPNLQRLPQEAELVPSLGGDPASDKSEDNDKAADQKVAAKRDAPPRIGRAQ